MNELVKQQWLIPFLPLVAAAVQALLPRTARKLSAGICLTAMGASCVLALRAFVGTLGHHEAERAVWNFVWFDYGTTRLELGFILDPMTAAMALMVAFVGFWIFVNATGYMSDDENFTRFFCFLSLFAAAMLGLVVANNLLMLFMCWELVGLCSYLLIGFWHFKPSAAAAMKKAFITTRIGDVGFFLGILLLSWQAGTLNLYDGGNGALEQAGALAGIPGWFGWSMATTIAMLLFIGAMGKSAQFPLHVWLPDAMEGPTPVSALIHAATMVAAGVFMVGRMFALFAADTSGLALNIVMWVGCFTALFSATIAVAQFDIKRVLAYSTCSQLGFMMMALGAGGLAPGQFHLLTHAFFKALLFLGSGCVIIGTHHEQDMRKMGGLRKYMPVTFGCYLIGMLALAGVPPFAGFWSKDEVLLVAFQRNKLAWGLATFAAFLTAFYMTRQMFMVFAGKWRGHHEPHEVPWNMWLPIAVLSVFAVGLGFFGAQYGHYLGAHGEDPHGKWIVMGLSVAVGAAGILLGWIVYGRRTMEHADEPDPLAVKLGALFTCLNRKWYVDEFYDATIIRATMLLGELWRAFDKLVIDGILHGIAWMAWGVSQVVRWVGDEFFINGGFDAGCESVRLSGREFAKFQAGRIQGYLRILCLGTVILLVIWYLK
ncbi:MAG: NADH-quinone oxidoreductase subunit L [Verrucomicrobia bacterium]|nr:NADH-quinone oxidoreductase subunit L [Verrucomicrobiota bacterium]